MENFQKDQLIKNNFISRLDLLKTAGGGFGALAFNSLSASSQQNLNPLAPKTPALPGKAKSVIWLFMNGGQSHVDTWDYKPELTKKDGKELPGYDKNTGFFANSAGPLMKSPWKFKQHGQCGKWVSELFPHLSKQVDRMSFIHSCYAKSNNHSPALFMMNTGTTSMGFPCVGSWVSYGLGSVNQNLPGFVVMADPLDRGLPKGHASNWGAGFLPGAYQGTYLKPKGKPIDNLSKLAHISPKAQRSYLDLVSELNHHHAQKHPQEAELYARMESFELAYRMQNSAPEALDINAEPEHIKAMYGLNNKKSVHFGKQCLTARRLVERGTRFIQIYSGGMENQRSWDGHNNIQENHSGFAQETDQPIAGLIQDLEQRGLLEETLIVCCGEFGRLPISQKSKYPGRDHNPHAFTTWMCGGGTKGGVSYGATDEVGFKAVENRVSIADLHATILELIGLDHHSLSFPYNGLDAKLTGVADVRVVNEIIA